MNIGAFVPSVNQTVKVAVAIVIIAMVLRYLPIPDNIRQLFRV